jgi:hypothetical protein
MADGLTVHRPTPCAECGGGFTPRRTTARFCSAACRLAAHRRLSMTEKPSPLPIHRTAIIRQNPGKNPQQNQWPVKRYFGESENSELSWVQVNDVTWKLTDGFLSREAVSGSLGSVSSPRALVWLTRNHNREGSAVWFARLGEQTFGPATIGAAKRAAGHMLEFGVTPDSTIRFKAAATASVPPRAIEIAQTIREPLPAA